MAKLYIAKIEHLYALKPSKRALVLTLNNRTKIRAEASYESWEQWGGTVEELLVTRPTVEAYNDWLHGGPLPTEEEK